MIAPWRLGLLLALGGLLAAGCSSSPSKPSTTTSVKTTTTTAPAPTTSTTVAATATTSTAAVTGCSGLTATVGQTNGAAGTITGSIVLSETGPSCTVTGYPSLALFNGSATVPSTVVDGLTVDISAPANGAPAPVTWSPSSSVEFTYQYSDVTTGGGACPTATSMTVTPPGSSTATAPVAISLAPCTSGTVRVSPLYASS